MVAVSVCSFWCGQAITIVVVVFVIPAWTVDMLLSPLLSVVVAFAMRDSSSSSSSFWRGRTTVVVVATLVMGRPGGHGHGCIVDVVVVVMAALSTLVIVAIRVVGVVTSATLVVVVVAKLVVGVWSPLLSMTCHVGVAAIVMRGPSSCWLGTSGDCTNRNGMASCRESARTPGPEIVRQPLTLGAAMGHDLRRRCHASPGTALEYMYMTYPMCNVP